VEIEVLDESEALVAQKTASVKLDSAYFPSIESPAAAPPPPVKNAIPAPVTIVLKPGSAATLASEDQTISINFRQGAVISQVPLTLAHYPALNAPFAPAEYQIADTCFKVEGLNGLLAKEATITVKYSASDLQSAEGDPSRLALGRWDEAAGEWTFLKTTVDPKNMTLKAATDRFSTWAVIVKPPGSSSLLLFSIWGIAAVLLLCGIWLTLKRKRRELRR